MTFELKMADLLLLILMLEMVRILSLTRVDTEHGPLGVVLSKLT